MRPHAYKIWGILGRLDIAGIHDRSGLPLNGGCADGCRAMRSFSISLLVVGVPRVERDRV